MAVDSLKAGVRTILPDPAYRSLRKWRLLRQVQGFEERVVRHRYGTRELSLVIADEIGRAWYDHDSAEPTELALLASGRMAAGSTVFDLGAHQAVVALMIADRVGPAGRVISVEATPHNHAVGLRNLALNGAENIVLVHAAVAREPGQLRFIPELNGRLAARGRLGTVDVRAVSIDELSREYGSPDVIYLDIEGFELEALKGAAETLRGMPDLFIEVHRGAGLEDVGGTADEVFALIQAAGYSSFSVALGDGEPFLPLAADRDLPPERFFLVAQAA